MTQTQAPPAPVDERRWRPTGRIVFFGVVLVVLLGYTEMAFELDWRSAGGRIGPGFFPRIIGILGVLIALGALITSFRADAVEEEVPLEDEVGEGDLGRHPVPLALTVAASAVFLVTLTTLGAILSGAVFMFGVLAVLNPRRWVVNAVLSVLVPLGMYLLFQTGLNAGLPDGLLPRI